MNVHACHGLIVVTQFVGKAYLLFYASASLI